MKYYCELFYSAKWRERHETTTTNQLPEKTVEYTSLCILYIDCCMYFYVLYILYGIKERI